MQFDFPAQLLILITAAVIMSSLFRRLNVPPTLAYLSVGLLVGPTAFGLVQNLQIIQFVAELGVVFLLFSLGLEFSLSKMIALRGTVFGLGSLQVIGTSLVIFVVALLLNATPEEATLIAGALALSSTAVVSKELVRRNELTQPHGATSIGILLFQDLAAVLFLILVPALGGDSEAGFLATVGMTLLKGSLLFVLLLAIGKWILPALFHEVARSHSEELFVLTVLMVSLLAAALTHSFGLSMALGGFIAGMMLSETHYKHQIEADIRPFRDLLLGLFFISVGMIVDVRILLAQWHWVIIATLALVTFKAATIFLIMRWRHLERTVALRTGLYLAQGGEFGFALFALAAQYHILPPQTSAIVIATVVLSIALTPLLIALSGRLAQRWTPQETQAPANSLERLESLTADLEQHAIICGFGRVGQIVARFLSKNGIPYIAIDNDPVRVMEASRAGEFVHYGDSTRTEILKALGLDRARLLVITYNDTHKSLKVIRAVREQEYATPILVRTADDRELNELRQAGATEVVPEVLEASLMMVSHVLTLMGVSAKTIFRTISETRQDRYQLLHGYYHGLQSRIVDTHGRPLEILHAVVLPEQAYACGKRIGELGLGDSGASLESLRRGEELTAQPNSTLVLQAGDTLILRGSADQVEFAESRLLAG